MAIAGASRGPANCPASPENVAGGADGEAGLAGKSGRASVRQFTRVNHPERIDEGIYRPVKISLDSYTDEGYIGSRGGQSCVD